MSKRKLKKWFRDPKIQQKLEAIKAILYLSFFTSYTIWLWLYW